MRRFQSRQFTIKSLLILMLVVASCFGWIRWTLAKLEKRWTNEQQVLVKLRGYKAELKTEPQAPEWLKRIVTKETAEIFDSITEIRVLSQPVDESTVQQIGQLENLRVLALNHCDIPDAWLVHLEGLRTLQWLELVNNPRITDVGLIHLRNMTEMRTLGLWMTSVSGTGLPHLRAMHQLDAIAVRCAIPSPIPECKIPADFFGQMNSLTVLRLNRLNFAEGQIDGLHDLRKLKTLDLSWTNIVDQATKDIAKLPNLETARFEGCAITDASVRYLSASQSVKTLQIDDTMVTDECFQYFESMMSLERLDIRAPMISKAAATRFKGSHNHIHITY